MQAGHCVIAWCIIASASFAARGLPPWCCRCGVSSPRTVVLAGAIDWCCRQSVRRSRAPFGGGDCRLATAITSGAYLHPLLFSAGGLSPWLSLRRFFAAYRGISRASTRLAGPWTPCFIRGAAAAGIFVAIVGALARLYCCFEFASAFVASNLRGACCSMAIRAGDILSGILMSS